MRLASFLALATLAAAAPTAARAQSAPAGDALTARDEQAVGVRHLLLQFRDGTPADDHGLPRYTGKWDAFAGADHHPIGDESFFRIVGRDDLALRYRRRAIVKEGLAVGGWVLVLGGAIATAVAVMPRAQPAAGGGPSPSAYLNPGWGLGAMGAGLASIIVGHFLDPAPIAADEADALARDHDQSLRASLGAAATAW